MGPKRGKMLNFPQKGLAQSPPSASKIDISASSPERFPALAGEELRTAVARIALYGTLRESFHSAEERSYRNVSQDDILHMLEGAWRLANEPEYDEAHRNWKYKLAGHDIEGDELVLVVAVDTDEQRITIITKF